MQLISDPRPAVGEVVEVVSDPCARGSWRWTGNGHDSAGGALPWATSSLMEVIDRAEPEPGSR